MTAPSAYPKFVLQLGYDRYLLSAAEAGKIMDMLASATRVASDWIGGESLYVLSSKPGDISLEPVGRPVLTQAEFEARAAAYAAKEAEEAEAA